jgi:hypothetical protein
MNRNHHSKQLTRESPRPDHPVIYEHQGFKPESGVCSVGLPRPQA